jgi:GMP synthase (glutamine-hydrolysing)
VQGDSRSYAPVLAIDAIAAIDGHAELDHERATALINRLSQVNRVIAAVATRVPLTEMRVRASSLTPDRIERLRRADAIVRRISHSSGFDGTVWQFPVILIPLGTGEALDSVVLRPVDSVDGMTARSVSMPPELLDQMCKELMAIPEIAGVFYDLTHKPPATIEWE